VTNGWDITDSEDGVEDAECVIIEGSASNDGIYPVTRTSDAILTISSDTDGSYFNFTAEAAGAKITLTPAKWKVVNVPSISISITNNCQFNYYNDDVASQAIVGRMGVEGSFQMPFGQAAVGNNWFIDRFLAGDQVMLAWYWGSQSTVENPLQDHKLNPWSGDLDQYKNDSSATTPKNFVSTVVNARITDYEVSGDNEVMIDVTFQGAGSSYAKAVELYTGYDADYLLRANG